MSRAMIRMGSMLIGGVLLFACAAHAQEKVLFDFEDEGEVGAWAPVEIPEAKKQEPAAAFAWSEEGATSGKHAMKITFDGGNFPHVGTTKVPDDWMGFQTIKADITAPRRMIVGFRVLQEKSDAKIGYGPAQSRWESTAYVGPGRTTVVLLLQGCHGHCSRPVRVDQGKVVALQFYACSPNRDESILIDNIRVSDERDPAATNTKPINQAGPEPMTFKILGTDLVVTGVDDLGRKLKDRWVKVEGQSVEKVEAEFRTRFEAMKKDHPQAVLAIFRQGAKGFDPKDPEKVYKGWEDAYITSHGPDGNIDARGLPTTDWGNLEVFMRHRSELIRFDLSSVPNESNTLAAQLVLVNSFGGVADKPNMFVAEPCNRPWVEKEVSGYQYAAGKLWQHYGGYWWWGDDPDFLPLYIAHGPAQGPVSAWDFTEAVKYFTDGKHRNNGFMLHGDAQYYSRCFTKDCKETEKRPMLMVIYETK